MNVSSHVSSRTPYAFEKRGELASDSRQKKIVDGVLIGVATALLVTFLSVVLGSLHVPGVQ